MVVIAAIVVVLSVAIPRYKAAHLATIETMVVREVQTVGQAQLQYSTLFGKSESMPRLWPNSDRPLRAWPDLPLPS